MRTRPVSRIGPAERVCRGQLVKTVYDPSWDEFILAIHPVNDGQPTLAPAWTEYYKENPVRAKRALLSLGAQVVTSSLGLILGA